MILIFLRDEYKPHCIKKQPGNIKHGYIGQVFFNTIVITDAFIVKPVDACRQLKHHGMADNFAGFTASQL